VLDRVSVSIETLAGAAGVELSPAQLAQLVRYLSTLATWNQTINLTALDLRGFPDQSLARLIIEPIEAARHLPSGAFRWFDLGSGGGSPSVPLKIMRPDALLTMVESRGRKAAFLRELTRVCELSQVDVLTTRIEELAVEIEPASVDVFTLRAVRLDAGVAATISRLAAASATVLLFGPVDWSALDSAFTERTATRGITILTRTGVPRGTSAEQP
jgi:16S rRNA (guanine(527)-N(7))-methyltransferase RsmG